MSDETVDRWTRDIRLKLKGRTIIEARYMNEDEQESVGWHSKAVVLILDDGNALFPSADDEGNNAGAIFTTYEELPTIPVI